MRKLIMSKESKDIGVCNLPIIEERKLPENLQINRESLIRYNEKKWVNNTVLHYYFIDNPSSWKGSERQLKAVHNAFNTWKDLNIGLVFKEVSNPALAEIRIGFERGSSWSYVGRDAIDLVADSGDRTMNFGWDLTTPYGKDTALHEIGHALGFPHEHQNPNSGIIWNEQKVYEYFAGPPNNWSREKAHYNVMRKILPSVIKGSKWDRDSIMHYQFKAGLIAKPKIYQTTDLIPNAGLSEVDITEARKFYPGKEKKDLPELEPFHSKICELKESEQKDFVIKSTDTRNYTIQTFGNLDTVIVLFEDYNGTPQYVAGDDDSGYARNSKLSVRLLNGRTYFLRIRLYYASDLGKGAVMLW